VYRSADLASLKLSTETFDPSGSLAIGACHLSDQIWHTETPTANYVRRNFQFVEVAMRCKHRKSLGLLEGCEQCRGSKPLRHLQVMTATALYSTVDGVAAILRDDAGLRSPLLPL
jgi:hypothetical protein